MIATDKETYDASVFLGVKDDTIVIKSSESMHTDDLLIILAAAIQGITLATDDKTENKSVH